LLDTKSQELATITDKIKIAQVVETYGGTREYRTDKEHTAKELATGIENRIVLKISDQFCLFTFIKPTKKVKANTEYVAELYKKEKLKRITFIKWNEPELDILKAKPLAFGINKEEFDAYFREDISKLFAIKIYALKG